MMRSRLIGGFVPVLAAWLGGPGCGATTETDVVPLGSQVQAQVVWAAGTQPSLKGAYWLKYDDNYNAAVLNDNRRVSWNLETPGFGGFDAAGVAALYTSYQIQTLIRIGDSARPSAADVAALNGASFTCSQLSGAFLQALDNEAGLANGAISIHPSSIAGFLFSNEPNIGPPLANSGWGISGSAYARAYNCYLARWKAGAKSGYPLLVAGPGGCNNPGVTVPGCANFYNGLFSQLGATVDGFTFHAYGTTTFVTGADLQGFVDQANRINQSKPGRPLYITEFAVGGNQAPPTGWGDYFNQRHDDVRTFNQTHGGQIKALIYFVDGLFGARRGSCASMTSDVWFLTSLCNPTTRGLWLNASSAQVSSPAQSNQADIVEGLSSVPAFQMPGQITLASIATRNPGLSTWSGGGSASAYRLGASTGNGFLFGSLPQCGGYSNNVLDARAYTCSAVGPGGSYTYQVNARAPTGNPSSATLGVRMVQDGVQWFGYGAQFPVGMGISSCGTALTQCILFYRPDILPFYAANNWNTSCPNHDAIISNWCAGGDVSACNALKAGVCGAFNSSCRCSGGSHLGGTAIDPNATFCNYQVCGQDHNIYSCQAGGWSNTHVICN